MGRNLFRTLVANGLLRTPEKAPPEPAPRRRMLLERLEDRLLFDAGPVAPVDADAELAQQAAAVQEAMPLENSVAEPAEVRVIDKLDDVQEMIADLVGQPLDGDRLTLNPNESANDSPNNAELLDSDELARQLLTTSDDLRSEVHAATAEWRDAPRRETVQNAGSIPIGHTETSETHDAERRATLSRREIAFVDTSVAGYEQLVEGILEHGDQYRQIEVVLINAGEDGLERIAETMRSLSGIDAIHLVSHGGSGRLQLGRAMLTLDSMSGMYAGRLAEIGEHLGADADILVYGCDFAAGDAGREAVNFLSRITGADVSASDDATGHAQLGGDWLLEQTVGTIESLIAVDSITQSEWQSLLAILDWDSVDWTNEALSGSYTVGGGTISLTITGDTDDFEPDSPEDETTNSGGLSPVQQSLFLYVDFESQTTIGDEQVVTTINFSHPGGVSNVSFSIFDIDLDSWTDQIIVTANNGATINPSSVTNGSANTFNGTNMVTGTSSNSSTSANGNATFTFNQSGITQVTIVYRSGRLSDPSGQYISLHDITFAVPPDIDLDASSTAASAADNFSSGYNNNSAGAPQIPWNGSWTENDPSDGANSTSAGDVQIVSGQLQISDTASGTGVSIRRAIDLSSYTSAYISQQLSFDFSTGSGVDNSDAIAVQISSNGGGSWTTLESFTNISGTSSGSRSYSIENYANANTQVRFVVTNGYSGSNEIFNVDNVVISAQPTGFANTFTEDGAGVAIADTDSQISDLDSTNMSRATITLTNPQTGDLLSVSGALPSGISLDAASTSTTLILTGSSSIANYQTAIEQIRFSNTSQNPSTTPRSITVVVRDDLNATSDTATATVTVVAVNDAPDAVNDSFTTAEDTPVAISVLTNDTDPEGNTLTITHVNGTAITAGGAAVAVTNGSVTLNGAGTQLTFSPTSNYNGAASFTYSISDGNGGTDTATVSGTVTAVNDAPDAVNDSFTTAEDTPVAISVLTNDTDPDGNTLTITHVNGTAITAGGAAVAVTNGSVTLNGAGTQLTFSPSLNYNGAASFTYRISDGNGGTDTATVSGTVTAVNDAPDAVNDSFTTAEDTPVAISVLTNDTDPEGNTLTITQVNGTAIMAGGAAVAVTNGSVTLNGAGTQLTFSPTSNYNGPASFTYTISDGNGGTDTATVSGTVTAVNDAPDAVNDSFTTAEDTPVAISVLTNDTDPEGNTLTITHVNGTAITAGGAAVAVTNGSVTLNGAGTQLTFTPSLNYNGPASFTYRISDGNGGTDTATVSGTVTAVNDAPDAVNDSFTTAEDTPVAISVLTNDTDPEGNSLTITQVNGTVITAGGAAIAVTNGSVTLNGAGTQLTFAPTSNYNGAASFTYSISDGNGGTDTATVSGTVTAVNDLPTATNNTASVTEDSSISDSGNVRTDNDGFGTDSDPDGDSLTVSAVNGSGLNVGVPVLGTYGTLTVAANGAYSYLLNNLLPAVQALDGGDTLTDSFSYTISDGNGGTSTANLTVTINGTDEAAVPGPSLVIAKGVVTSDNGGATFSGAVGPASAMFQAPGSAISFSGSLTTGDLALAPVDANVSTVDAADLVRFTITLQNLGGSDAFDIRLQDLLPSGYQIPAGGLGLNLIVTDGDGNAIAWRGLGSGVASDLFGSGIELLDSTAVFLMADSGNVTTRMDDRDDFNSATNETTVGPWVNASGAEALAMHPTTGVLYGSDNSNLGTISRTTGTYTDIGSGFGTANGTLGSFDLTAVNGLSFHPTSHELYAVHRRGGGPDLLFKVNTTTGAFIADAFGTGRDYIPIDTDAAGVGSEIDDIAFDPTTGNLFATMADRLIRITLDETAGTSTITDVGTFGSGVNDMEGLSFDRDGNLWGTTGNNDGTENNRLWEIDKTTGAASNFRQLDNASDYEGLVIDGPGTIGALRSLTHATLNGDGSNVLVLTYDLQLTSAVAPLQSITNTATLTNYAATDYGTDLTVVDVTDTASTTITAAATVKSLLGTSVTSASNSASQVTIGETAQYSVTVTLPEGALPGSFVLDNLDEGLQFVSLDSIAAFSGGVASGAVTSSVGAFSSTSSFNPSVSGTGAAGSPQTLTFNLGTLTNSNTNNAAAETLVLTYTVRVANIAQNDGNGTATGTLRNNAAHFTWTANSTTQTTANANAANVEVIEPQLNIAKSISDATPNLGDVVTYTLTLTHTASSDTDAFDIRLLDTLPAGTTLNLGSISAAGATITTNNSAGNTLDVTLDDLPFGVTATVTFTATVTSSVGDIGLALSNTVNATWTSLAGAFAFERDGDNPAGVDDYADSDTNNATVVNPALSVTIDNGAASVSAGQTFSYSVVVTNNGNSPATGIEVTGTIPTDRLNFVSTDDAANFSIDGSGNFTWTHAIANLAAGATRTLTLTVQVPATLAAGINDVTVSANVTHDNIEPTPANNTDDDIDTLNAAPDLALTKSDGGVTVNPGDVVVYTLSYSNGGTQGATGVVISETIPVNAMFNAAASSPGWTDLGGGNYSFNVGSVAAGASGNVLFAVTVNSTLPAGVTQLSNSASIVDDTTNGPDPGGDNTGSDTTPLDAAPDYSVSLDDGFASVTEGQSLTYTLNFANGGDQNGTGVVITATFPTDVLENVAASNGGIVDPIAGRITWNVGSLAAGANGSFTITADVRDPVPVGTMMFTLGTSITDDAANGADPTPANNSADDTDNVIVNQAPTGADNAVTTPEDTDFVFDVTDFPFSDPDSDPLAEVRIDSLPMEGLLLLDGVPVGTGDVIDATDIAAGRLVFAPDANENGSPYTAFEFTVSDGMTFAAASNTMTVHVTPVDDAPTGGDNAVTTPEDTDFVFVPGDFPYSDLEGEPLTQVRIDSLPVDGTLLLFGNPVAANDVIALADIATGGLAFRPDADENGSPYTAFEFSVGNASAFVSSPGTMTVHVTPTTVSVVKSLFDSSDPNTVGNNVTIGEELCFALLVTLSEGNSTDLILTDLLPDGLAYDSFTLITDAASSSGLLTADFNGSVPAPSISGGAFDGDDVSFTFGAITVAADAVATNNSFVLLVHAFVSDVPSNHDPLAGTPTLTNTATADVSNPQPPTPSNPFDVTVVEPDLSLTIDNGVATLTAGETTTYSITITNDGDLLATGVSLSGLLPIERVSFVSTDDAANFSIDGSGNFVWTPAIASLASGASITLQLTAQVTSSLASGITDVTIPVSVTHDNVEPTPANNSANDTDSLDAAPDLQVTKTDFTGSITPGGGSVYTIGVSNIGTQAATNVLVTETVPVGTMFNAALSDPLWTLIAPEIYQISLPTLAAGAGFNVNFAVTVNTPAMPGQTEIINTVTIADDGSNGPDPDPTNDSATDTNTLVAAPDYQITISDGETTVAPGQSLSYTISFTNVGSQNGTGLVVTDTFSIAVLENVVASDGGIVDAVAGTITWNVGNLAVGDSRTFTVTANVRTTVPAGVDDFTHDTTITDDLANGADPTPGNNSGSDTDTLAATPDYHIAINDGQTAVAPGQALSYTINFLNAGNQDGTGVVVSDTFPPEILENVVASDGGIVDAVAGTITWNVGTLAAGESRSFTVTANVRATIPTGFDDFTHATTISDDSANGADPTPVDNSADDTDTLDAQPDYQISIDDGVLSATTGQLLTYSVLFTNAGLQDGTGVIVGTSFPLSVLTNVVASNGGIVDMTTGTITWNVGSLAAGATLTYTVTADVLSSVTAGIDDFTHSATITDDGANGADPTPADNSAADTDTLDAAPDLQVTKTDFTNSISPGQGTVYTLNVSNIGTQEATNVFVTETLPVGTSFNPAFSDPAWTDLGGGVYQYVIASLTAGAGFNINFSVLIDNSAAAGQDNIVNTATIADDGSNGPDLDPTNDSATDTNTLDAVPNYDIGIDNLQTTVTPGQSVTYYVNFNNYGLQNGTGVVITATFPTDLLTNVVASDGGLVDAVAGTITWNVGALTANDPQTFEITADVVSTIAAGITDLTLTAAITDDGANGTDPDLSDNSAFDTDTMSAAPDLQLTKTDYTDSISPREGSVYTLNIANIGNQAATNVIVTESVPVGTTFNPAFSDPSWTNLGGGVFQYVIANLPAGVDFNIDFSVLINDPAAAGQEQIVNIATISDDGLNGPDPDPSNNTATDTNTLDAVPMYDIGIDDLQTSVTPGQSLTYYVNFNNYGLQNGTGVVITVNFPTDLLTNVAASDGGIVDAVAGTITWNIGNLLANDPRTFEITADVAPSVDAGINDITLTASITDDGSNGHDPDLSDNNASDTDMLDAAPDLQLTKTDYTNSISPGECSTYTITVANFGTQGATNIVVTETIPAGATFNAALSDPGWTNVGGNVYQLLVPSLAAGDFFNVNFSILIDNPAVAGQEQIVNIVTISDDGTNGPDSDPSNNSATDTNTLDALPNYDIGIDDLQTTVTPGESLTYYVNFNNYGLQNGTGVVVTATFPTTLLTNVVASNGGIVDALAGTITWNVGALTANDPQTFEITADVVATIPAGIHDLTLTASIADDGANGADPDLSDNTSSDTDTLNAQPDYAITIDDGETQARPGDILTYTINVANNGNQDGTGVVVTVSFPVTVLQNVVASSGGIVDAVAGTITWNLGDLNAGDATTLTVSTQVRSTINSSTPTLTLTATVTDDGVNGTDPTPLNNTSRDLDQLQLYAYDSFHDWKDMRFGFLAPQQFSVGRPLAPLPVDPVFSGLTEPGSTLVARIYSADGRLLGDRQVVADSGGNWLVTFPNLIIYEYPHRMEIIVTPAINNLAHENGFNLRRYFHPAIHAGLVMTEPMSVAGVFRNRAYNIVEAQHSANTHPLGFQWYSHAYELNAASSNVSQM